MFLHIAMSLYNIMDYVVHKLGPITQQMAEVTSVCYVTVLLVIIYRL